jgi:hypothetical protein
MQIFILFFMQSGNRSKNTCKNKPRMPRADGCQHRRDCTARAPAYPLHQNPIRSLYKTIDNHIPAVILSKCYGNEFPGNWRGQSFSKHFTLDHSARS